MVGVTMVVIGCSSQQNQKEVEESSECQVEPCSYHAKTVALAAPSKAYHGAGCLIMVEHGELV